MLTREVPKSVGSNSETVFRLKGERAFEVEVWMSERLFEVLPYINFGQWSAPVAYRREVSGLLTSPIPIYWNVTKGG